MIAQCETSSFCTCGDARMMIDLFNGAYNCYLRIGLLPRISDGFLSDLLHEKEA